MPYGARAGTVVPTFTAEAYATLGHVGWAYHTWFLEGIWAVEPLYTLAYSPVYIYTCLGGYTYMYKCARDLLLIQPCLLAP